MGLFGPGHMLWLFGGLAVLALLLPRARRNGHLRRRLARWIGLLLPALELARLLALLRMGALGPAWLPLHLCGLSIFLVAWHSLRGGTLAGEILYALTLPGAAMALVCPDWVRLPTWNCLSLTGFAIHWLLVAYPLLLLTDPRFRPEVRRLPRVLVVLLVTVGLVYGVDRHFRVNYFYLLEPPPGSPLVWFVKLWGKPGYLWGYLPLLAAVWLCLYLPWRRNSRGMEAKICN